jgi:hypothetical protein
MCGLNVAGERGVFNSNFFEPWCLIHIFRFDTTLLIVFCMLQASMTGWLTAQPRAISGAQSL